MNSKENQNLLSQLRSGNSLAYLLVFTIHYICVFFTRPYHLASQIGWLDPWTAVGFGQVFPETPYPWHYYKESRFFSILYQWILTHAEAGTYLFIQTFVVSICGVLVFFFLRRITRSNWISLILSLLVSTSSLLWGDSAGGADYYNTLGNILIVLTFIFVFKFQSASSWGSHLRGLSILIGCLSYITLIEAPSGIVVVFGFQLSLLFWFWMASNGRLRNFIVTFKDFLLLQMVGVASLLLFQSFVLLLLGQSPIRLLSGPKFLFDSLVNSDTQENWWRVLNLDDFLKTDYLAAFAGLGVLSILISVVLLSMFNRNPKLIQSERGFQFLLNCLVAYSITWIILICLQVAGKSVALTLGYFTTPFIFTGFLLVLSFLGYIITVSPKFYAIPTWPPALLLSFFLTISLVSPIHPTVNRSYDFLECEKIRLEFRSSALELAEKIDSTFGPRGTLLMGADDSIFEKRIDSKCSTIDGRPISESLMSLSQLGFPGVSILGKPNNGDTYEDYPRQYLANPFGREVAPTGCVLVWRPSQKNELGTGLHLKLGSEVLVVEKICP
jgi:hypothetical protein